MSYVSNVLDALIFVKALKQHIFKCKFNFSYWLSSCQKDKEGRCVSFSSNLLNLQKFSNIELVVWNHHTNWKFHNKFIYLDRSKTYTENIPEKDRNYTLLVGPLDIVDTDVNSLNNKMIDELYRGLFHGDFAYMIFHEVTHLNNAKTFSSQEMSRLHHNYLKYARTKQSVERFPQIAFSLGMITGYAEKPKENFVKDFPNPNSFVSSVLPPEKEIVPERKESIKVFEHKKKKNINSIKNKLATLWQFIAEGGIETINY
jgi:hypothetical protein